MTRMSLLGIALLAGLNAGGAFADDWCIPGDGCTGPEPIRGNRFSTCEEECTMSNPVPVRGLDATLYDVSCKGDWGGLEYRMMLGKHENEDGSQRAYIVKPSGPEELERCAS